MRDTDRLALVDWLACHLQSVFLVPRYELLDNNMKRPINVQPEVTAYYLEIQMQGRGWEEGTGGGRQRGVHRERRRRRERPSFFRIKPAISENNNKPLSDINVLWTAKKYSPESTTLFKLEDSNKMLKVADVISHASGLM